jgi:hypothetical protein
MMAFVSHADKSFYEEASQVIPVLLLAAAVGESRLKARKRVNANAAVVGFFVVAAVICAGEVAALRVLITGQDSETLFDLTTLSLGLGLGFVIDYLVHAVFRDVVGPDAPPKGATEWLLTLGTLVVALGTVFLLAA